MWDWDVKISEKTIKCNSTNSLDDVQFVWGVLHDCAYNFFATTVQNIILEAVYCLLASPVTCAS